MEKPPLADFVVAPIRAIPFGLKKNSIDVLPPEC